jgi:hypothetical protein
MLPVGTNIRCVVLDHYENQSEDDAVAEDEAGIQPSETVINVPATRAEEPDR